MENAGWAWSGGTPFDQPIGDRSSEVGDRSDTVLDVAQTARWSGCLGREATVVPVPAPSTTSCSPAASHREHAYTVITTRGHWSPLVALPGRAGFSSAARP
ncbi:hypothetical protein [Streptomyces sp. NPDC001480]|uniref:hypothetical protein n=1 Tax=Streptomyces sp. NPDC001480 TaxID=3364577 RepID=UPI0036AFD3A5